MSTDTAVPDEGSWPRNPAERFCLRDGRELLIRDMRPEDRDREQAFVRGLSDRARRFRFMSLLKELPPRLLEQFTQPDPARETVLVVVDLATDRFVAVARFIRTKHDNGCEFAIVVDDHWRGLGLGRMLMERLIRDAEARGMDYIEGIILSDNRDMRHLLRPLGFRFEHRPGEIGVFFARLDLPRPQAGS